jgi:hypothetical protein
MGGESIIFLCASYLVGFFPGAFFIGLIDRYFDMEGDGPPASIVAWPALVPLGLVLVALDLGCKGIAAAYSVGREP